jgi:hypothetical protein
VYKLGTLDQSKEVERFAHLILGTDPQLDIAVSATYSKKEHWKSISKGYPEKSTKLPSD